MSIAPLVPVLVETWPPIGSVEVGPFTIPDGGEGGNRVNAARLSDPKDTDATIDQIIAVEAAMRRAGRKPLFSVCDHQVGLNARLDELCYLTRDATDALVMPCADLAATPPPVTTFAHWAPLAIQTEIWAAGGIGPARLAIMERATGPKTSILARIDDRPAGTAYVGIHDGTAMLHALEITTAARRRGLAGQIMRRAAAWALSQGAETLAVLVTRQNKGAQGLYASLGMKAVGSYAYREQSGEISE